jgi:hypothetical protein
MKICRLRGRDRHPIGELYFGFDGDAHCKCWYFGVSRKTTLFLYFYPVFGFAYIGTVRWGNADNPYSGFTFLRWKRKKSVLAKA